MRLSQHTDTMAEDARLILNPTNVALSESPFSKIMSKYVIIKFIFKLIVGLFAFPALI